MARAAGLQAEQHVAYLVCVCGSICRQFRLTRPTIPGAGEHITRMSLARTICESVEAAEEDGDIHSVLQTVMWDQFHSSSPSSLAHIGAYPVSQKYVRNEAKHLHKPESFSLSRSTMTTDSRDVRPTPRSPCIFLLTRFDRSPSLVRVHHGEHGDRIRLQLLLQAQRTSPHPAPAVLEAPRPPG